MYRTLGDFAVEKPQNTAFHVSLISKHLPVGEAYFGFVDGRTPPRWSSTSLSRSQTALAHLDEVFDGFQRARC